jgi:type IX secretion system PorP/SprF family membrane protein
MKKLLFLFIVFFAITSLKAQEHALLAQYMYNRLVFNPAYAGSNEGLSGSLSFRKQWLTFNNAPFTGQLSVDGLLKNNKVGLGLNIGQDIAGALKRTDLFVNYAYRLSVDNESVLAFGLKGGTSFYSLGEVDVLDQGDDLFLAQASGFMPKVGAGLYFDNPGYYIGVSVPDLIQYDPNGLFKDSSGTSWKAKKDLFITGGYNFYVNELITLVPSTFARLSSQRVLVDLNLNLNYNDKFAVGAGWRLGNAFILMGRINLNEKIKMGVAYEYKQFGIKLPSNGSVEFMLSYNLAY